MQEQDHEYEDEKKVHEFIFIIYIVKFILHTSLLINRRTHRTSRLFRKVSILEILFNWVEIKNNNSITYRNYYGPA